MSSAEKVNQLIEWLQGFKSKWINNEDEVETKFVIPLFQKLGYSDEFYRGKYPTKVYSPGKKGRKPESDRVYFSTSEPESQNMNTCLIVVEAKEPKEINFSQAIEQAKFYETHLKPIFLVVTNGCRIIVIKPNRYVEPEIVFDLKIEDFLSKNEIAKKFHEQINFEIVSHNKKQHQESANALPHERYVFLESAIRKHPELQLILEQGGFEVGTEELSASRFRVVRQTVSIECELPILLKKGCCEITFSNILRRGLKVQVNHQYIIGNFMIGLDTSPDWGTRPFIRKISQDTFSVTLGETFTTLSRSEVEDLCFCIDEVGQRYRTIILEIDNLLETEKYKPVNIPVYNLPGFHILSVQQWLWDLMKRFSEEKAWERNKSEWNIFEWNARAIRIEIGLCTNAWLYPIHSDTDGYSNDLLNGYVDVIYAINDTSFDCFSSLYKTPWQQNIGPKGIWTVCYTKSWLIEKLIPEIESYYSEEIENYDQFYYRHMKRKWHSSYTDYETSNNRRLPLEKATEPKHLEPYLNDVQSWIHIYLNPMPSSILEPYYKHFVRLCAQADFSTANIGYLVEKLYALELQQMSKEYDDAYMESLDKNYVLSTWHKNVERIQNIDFERSFYADLMSRTFIAIINDCKIRYSQSDFNAAKQTLFLLWQRSQFDERYVFPNR